MICFSLDYYKKCETCDVGYGPDGPRSCKTCVGKDCGVCGKSYKKCEAKIAVCPKTAIKTAATGVNSTKWAPDGGFDYCEIKEPGVHGNGYSSLFVGAVNKKGDCTTCNGPDFRPYTDGDMKFCSFYEIGRTVAANAFTAQSGCAFPGSVEFKLTKTCVSQKSDLPFSINLVYEVMYCKQKKTVAVTGGGVYRPKPKIDDIKEWFYAVKP